MTDRLGWSWMVGADADAIHALLCASDAHHAAAYGLPIPTRRLATTQRLVQAGAVQVLLCGAEPVGTFTLTNQPPFAQPTAIFPHAQQPAYLQRLAIAPTWLERTPLLGARCLRRAIQLATASKADALRAEANPDLTATAHLLATFGFVPCGPAQPATGLRRVYLYKQLTSPTASTEAVAPAALFGRGDGAS